MMTGEPTSPTKVGFTSEKQIKKKQESTFFITGGGFDSNPFGMGKKTKKPKVKKIPSVTAETLGLLIERQNEINAKDYNNLMKENQLFLKQERHLKALQAKKIIS